MKLKWGKGSVRDRYWLSKTIFGHKIFKNANWMDNVFYLFEDLRSLCSFTQKSSGYISVFTEAAMTSVPYWLFPGRKVLEKRKEIKIISPSLLTPIQEWSLWSIQGRLLHKTIWYLRLFIIEPNFFSYIFFEIFLLL